jgi:hypothetical protein
MSTESAPVVAVALKEFVIERIVSVVSSPATAKRLAVAAEYRISCEGWLKLELVHDLRMFLPPTDIRPESILAASDALTRAAADIAINRGDERVLVELKTFPTNYGGAGKPITNFIDSVVADLQKLRVRRGSATGLVAWLAYPIPDGASSWAGHLERVKQAAATTCHCQRCELPSGFAHFYVMECL